MKTKAPCGCEFGRDQTGAFVWLCEDHWTGDAVATYRLKNKPPRARA